MPYTGYQDVAVFQDEVPQHVSAFSEFGGTLAEFGTWRAKMRMLEDLAGCLDDCRCAATGGGWIALRQELMEPVDIHQGVRMPD
jgi:hypothetical protein